MPPLNALKAFEAAARHESFAKAADELGVTPAAVSHQIKGLEDWLGAELFVRRAQGLRLTDAAKSALNGFVAAFDALGSAVQDLRVAARGPRVRIAALPSIAQLWLGPRLPAMRAAFPEARPSVYALEEPPDFRREPFDLGFFLLREPSGSGQSFKLRDDHVFPVCDPKIAAALKTPADVMAYPLLWDTTWADDWACWLTAAGVAPPPTNDGPAFSLYSLAVQAAVDGAGVLMAHESLVEAQLKSGALVAPFEIIAETGLQLELLAPHRPSALTAKLIDWFVGRS
jgi:LysR family glycine cleavage system transcriptional activator